MKFGQTLKAVATSLGMFAAGSWIVPCFSLTSVTQIASAVPMSENSNDNTWSGSDVARAWASATGSEYDPASQVLVMQSGEDHVPVVLDQVRSEDGRSVGFRTSWWISAFLSLRQANKMRSLASPPERNL